MRTPMSQGDVAFGHGHRFGDENAAFFGNVSQPVRSCPTVFCFVCG